MKNSIQRYSKGFYSKEEIKRAMKDYQKIASISLSEDRDYYVCSFSKCIADPQRVIREFDNYLIELMNSRGAFAEA